MAVARSVLVRRCARGMGVRRGAWGVAVRWFLRRSLLLATRLPADPVEENPAPVEVKRIVELEVVERARRAQLHVNVGDRGVAFELVLQLELGDAAVGPGDARAGTQPAKVFEAARVA